MINLCNRYSYYIFTTFKCTIIRTSIKISQAAIVTLTALSSNNFSSAKTSTQKAPQECLWDNCSSIQIYNRPGSDKGLPFSVGVCVSDSWSLGCNPACHPLLVSMYISLTSSFLHLPHFRIRLPAPWQRQLWGKGLFEWTGFGGVRIPKSTYFSSPKASSLNEYIS